MSDNWKPGAFEVVTDAGCLLRRGEIAPPFGLHEDDDGDRLPWLVTHLPTGRCLPCRFVSVAAAKVAVTEIRTFGDWDFDRIDARIEALAVVMTPTIDEWCARGLCERNYVFYGEGDETLTNPPRGGKAANT